MTRFDHKQVLVSGYVVLDVLQAESTPHLRSVGGTAGNVASNLAWMGVSTAVAARIGADPAGKELLERLDDRGVDSTWSVNDHAVATPLVLHTVTTRGTHRFSYTCPQCGRRFPSYRPTTADQLLTAVAYSKPELLFLDRASSAALAAAQHVRSYGGTVFFEPNGLGREDLTRKLMAESDFVKVSGERMDPLSDLLGENENRQIQIVTHGEEGLEYQVEGRGWRSLKPYPVSHVVDPGGAGDWTTAGLILVLSSEESWDSKTLEEGLRFGQALGSLSCAYLGAQGLAALADPVVVHSALTTTVGRSAADRAVGAALKKLREVPKLRNTGSPSSCPTCLDPIPGYQVQAKDRLRATSVS